MIEKDLNYFVSVYKGLLANGDVQVAYTELVKYIQKLRTTFSKELTSEYSIGNIFQGYMDYTYFYISNDYLKRRKLKLGLVLNHTEMRFEVWLLGQTKDVQRKYWDLLKNTKWINEPEIPQYSIFEFTLIKEPDFDDLELLTHNIKEQFLSVADEISATLRQTDK